ncbi:MAG: type IV secretory system conjugative DNA transfer family protein [Endomicrobium sp.]|jgi:type IV secretion system protein VirD4|nr:type IV secretory system conjugative DNA transfer family protein [Endomicrobium sp.]
MYKEYKQEGQGFNLSISLIVLVITYILVSSLLTQYIAYKFNFQPALGKPINWIIYNPFMWMKWTYLYGKSYPNIFDEIYAAALIMHAVPFICFMLSRLFKHGHGYEGLHGTAHWATKREIKSMGILNSEGVYIGAWMDGKNIRYLRHNGPEHVFVFAPTRSGKGVGLVIPTLLSWPHSCVVLDIKGENWELTAGWRQKYAKNRTLKFDPSSINSSICYNPLEEIRIDTEYEVADTQNIATMLIDIDGKGLNDYWRQANFSLLTGLILHTIYKAKNMGAKYPNLSDVYSTLNNPDIDVKDLFEDMRTYAHKNGQPHSVVALIAREMLNKTERELSGVVGTASAAINLYSDPIIAKNTNKSDFKIADLMNCEIPISLYITIKPADKDRLKPLIRLIMSQIHRNLIGELKFENGLSIKNYKHRLLIMFDEFASLGKIDIVQESVAFQAGYGIKSYYIVQDLTQLWNTYGKNESITSNCHIRIAYAPNKIETAEYLSKMSGISTIIKKQVNTSGKRAGLVLEGVSESYQEVSRPLITADECMRLHGPKKDSFGDIAEPGDMLIFIAGQSPIYGKQILFFKDPVFSDRSKISAPTMNNKVYTDGFDKKHDLDFENITIKL